MSFVYNNWAYINFKLYSDIVPFGQTTIEADSYLKKPNQIGLTTNMFIHKNDYAVIFSKSVCLFEIRQWGQNGKR